MLAWFRQKFRPSGGHPQPTERPLAIDYFYYPDRPAHRAPEPPIKVSDFYDPSTAVYRPVDPVELLNVHFALVEQIYQASGMTRHQFHDLILPILIHASSAYQLLPASQASHHRELGGLLLHSLQVVRHAVHLGQVARFERDLSRSVAPQDQRLWSFCLALAAATHDAGKPLTDFRVVHPTFFTPGRLLPRLGEGPPAQDEPALYNPFRDTLYDWQVRNRYGEYTIRWLDDRFNRHKLPAATFRRTWMGALDCRNLPEKFTLVLEADAPSSGTVEADFWSVVAKADARSSAEYFPSTTREPGLVVADCMRDLVSRGVWRPGADQFPLKRLSNDRLLLRAPTDLADLAAHLSHHSEGRLLTTSGVLPSEQLAGLLQFGLLLETGYAADSMYQPERLGLSLPDGERLLVLSGAFSRELLELAASAPPAPLPQASPEPPPVHQTPAGAPASPPGAVDLSHLADPVAPVPGPSIEVANQPPPEAEEQPSRVGRSQVPADPQPQSPPGPASGPPMVLPYFVYEFLQYVQAQNPSLVYLAQRGEAPPFPEGHPASWIEVELNVGIHIHRNLVKRFAKRKGYSLDQVFRALLASPEVVAAAAPPPPAPTERITLTNRASRAVYQRTLEKFARSGPFEVALSEPALSVPGPPPVEQSPHEPGVDVQALLRVLAAAPSVKESLRARPDALTPVLVPFSVLLSVIKQLDPGVRKDQAVARLQSLTETLLAEPFRSKRAPDGLLLSPRTINLKHSQAVNK